MPNSKVKPYKKLLYNFKWDFALNVGIHIIIYFIKKRKFHFFFGQLPNQKNPFQQPFLLVFLEFSYFFTHSLSFTLWANIIYNYFGEEWESEGVSVASFE